MEGNGCWLYVGQGKETEGTPHTIYGKVFLNGRQIKATLSIINLTSEEQGITESNEEGKFAFDLLNLGWKAGDKILVSANAEGAQKDIFLDIDPKVPNQRIDINLEKPVKPTFKQFILILIAIILFGVLIFAILAIKIIKKKKK